MHAEGSHGNYSSGAEGCYGNYSLVPVPYNSIWEVAYRMVGPFRIVGRRGGVVLGHSMPEALYYDWGARGSLGILVEG